MGNEGTYRSGEGGGGPATNVTLDLSYSTTTTTGSECERGAARESSARIINKWDAVKNNKKRVYRGFWFWLLFNSIMCLSQISYQHVNPLET